MRLQEIRISNLLGITERTISVDRTLTQVTGGNGTGKSSVLTIVGAALGGGHDATLLRKGAQRGEAVLVFDDGSTVDLAVTETDTKREANHPVHGPLKRTATFLDKLRDLVALNPIAFLTAPAKKRTEWLLEVLPIAVTDEELKASGCTVMPPPLANGLDRIAAARKLVYEARHGSNLSAKNKRVVAQQLLQGVPPAPVEGLSDLESLRAQKAGLDEKGKAAEEQERAGLAASEQRFNEGVEELRRCRAIRDEQIRQEARTTLAALRPELEAIAARIGSAEQAASRVESDRVARENAARNETDALEHERESEAYTATIERLDALKLKALSALPIKGLEIRDGDIYLDGVAFDRVNTAARIAFALNVAKLRAGELPLVLCDGFEALDPDSWQAFHAAAEASGLQLIVTRVTEGPLVTGALQQ